MVGEDEARRGSFYIVYIPAIDSNPIEEWSIDLPKDKEAQIGCLTDHLRKHFSNSKLPTTSNEKQQEKFKQQLLSQLPKNATLDPNMLEMMLQMDSLVDAIPLVLNSKDAEHIGVNMYVDDKGTAKELPSNARASSIAQSCGKALEVRGDAFIGRVFDNDDDFIRMDFRMNDVSMDAPWVSIAKSQSKKVNKTVGSVAHKSNGLINVCGAELCSANGSLRCSRCKAQYYCSAKCQKADWKRHKQTCHSL